MIAPSVLKQHVESIKPDGWFAWMDNAYNLRANSAYAPTTPERKMARLNFGIDFQLSAREEPDWPKVMEAGDTAVIAMCDMLLEVLQPRTN